MSYQGPIMISEPDLRWPIVVLAAFVTALIALLTTVLYYLAMAPPALSP